MIADLKVGYTVSNGFHHARAIRHGDAAVCCRRFAGADQVIMEVQRRGMERHPDFSGLWLARIGLFGNGQAIETAWRGKPDGSHEEGPSAEMEVRRAVLTGMPGSSI